MKWFISILLLLPIFLNAQVIGEKVDLDRYEKIEYISEANAIGKVDSFESHFICKDILVSIILEYPEWVCDYYRESVFTSDYGYKKISDDEYYNYDSKTIHTIQKECVIIISKANQDPSQ